MPVMFDAVNIGAIPDDAQIVAPYVNGRYANGDEARVRFPDAVLAPIWVFIPGRTVNPVADATSTVSIARDLGRAFGATVVLDVEASDAGLHADEEMSVPIQALLLNLTGKLGPEIIGALAMGNNYAPQWVDTVRALGFSPTVYTSRSTWPTLADANPDDWWIAEYTGHPHLIDGAAACQWTAPETGSPGDYDISETRDFWPRRGAVAPHVDPDPLRIGGRLMGAVQ